MSTPAPLLSTLLIGMITTTLTATAATTSDTNKAKISRTKQLEIYSKMQSVCDRWKRWYQRDRSETARINMNIACRDAAQYATQELAITVDKPKYVTAKKKKKKAPAKPNAQLLSARKVGGKFTGKPKCSQWQSQIEKIQNKLRSGYKEPQGNKLRQQRRNLWQLVRDNC